MESTVPLTTQEVEIEDDIEKAVIECAIKFISEHEDLFIKKRTRKRMVHVENIWDTVEPQKNTKKLGLHVARRWWGWNNGNWSSYSNCVLRLSFTICNPIICATASTPASSSSISASVSSRGRRIGTSSGVMALFVASITKHIFII
jgi:hypothetical protein